MDNILGIYILSGKRCTGKDYFAARLQKHIRERTGKACVFWSGSVVLKREYCEYAGLSLERMLTDRAYKDNAREAMTAYFHNVMAKKSPDYCNTELIKDMLKVSEPTIFVFDIRYEFEIDCYVKHNLTPNIVKIRINVDEEIKKRRGWVYDPKIDEDVSEKDLDNYTKWDHVFENNVDGPDSIDEFIESTILQ